MAMERRRALLFLYVGLIGATADCEVCSNAPSSYLVRRRIVDGVTEDAIAFASVEIVLEGPD